MEKFTLDEILERLRSLADPDSLEGMKRYGINTENAYGVSLYALRPLAREIGKDHELAQKLWDSGIHEARILAPMVDEPGKVTEKQMEDWVSDIDSWDICDQTCSNLFDKTSYAYKKAVEWSSRDEEFVKRAGFVLMAALSVHDKKALDEKFEEFFPMILREADDDRNFVKKAVNWALRQIGKRNIGLNKKAIKVAEKILEEDSKAARWISTDALRELKSERVQKRVKGRTLFIPSIP
jgi:3-methyladenine DNA glycosylase AlkD